MQQDYEIQCEHLSITGTHLIPIFFSVLKSQCTVMFTIYTYIQIKLAEIYIKSVVSHSEVQKPNLKADQGEEK